MPFGGLLTAGAIGAGGSILGGLFGKNGAKSAAKTQAEAAERAGQHVEDVTREVNPQIGVAADQAATGVRQVADEAASGVTDATTRANERLNPYADLGTQAVNALALRLSEFDRTPTMEDLEIDPGFAFRLEEGEKALARSGAVRGNALGGSALKSLARYSQGVASDEYQKAFDRYRTSVNDRFERLTGVADRGQAAATTQGNRDVSGAEFAGTVRTGAAEYAGNAGMHAADTMTANTINAARVRGEYSTSGANATAAGQVAGANAWANGISGAGGSIMNALILRNLTQPKATTPAPVPATSTPKPTPKQP